MRFRSLVSGESLGLCHTSFAKNGDLKRFYGNKDEEEPVNHYVFTSRLFKTSRRVNH
jgi:hypothetical protein